MRNFLTRSISGIVYVSLFLFAILFSDKSYIALTSIFGLVCIWELSKLIQFKSILPYILLVLGVSAYTFYQVPQSVTLFFLVIALLCLIRLIAYLYSKDTNYPKSVFDKIDVMIRYIVLPFIFLIQLPFINSTYEPYIVIYILVLIWTNDSFAYIVGKNFGKRKLFERISPKKTIEGFIGGWAFALITAYIIGQYSTNFTTINWLIIATIISVLGTIGDLVESKFKRQANSKDSGTIMPGHGGLLDRLDSLFFAAPFVYLYIHYFI